MRECHADMQLGATISLAESDKGIPHVCPKNICSPLYAQRCSILTVDIELPADSLRLWSPISRALLGSAVLCALSVWRLAMHGLPR